MKAELFDAGTTLNILPWMDTPGMHDGYFRDLDMEYTWPGEFQTRINEALRTTETRVEFLPWPEPFPGRSWIDWTPRYEGEDGGLKIETKRYEVMFDQYSDVSGKLTQIPTDASYSPILDINDTRVADSKTIDEIQAEHEHPTEWLRKPLSNEQGGSDYAYCQLETPAWLIQNHHIGDEFRPVVNYSPLFAPVDLTHPEWYDVMRSDGTYVEEPLRRISLRQDGRYRLYLRPANWRWVATVWANYLYVSFFEMFTTRLIFTTAWFDRPPTYPRRHDLIHTTQTADWEYMNNYYSTDAGISYACNASRGAAFLRHQIIDAQWWTQSEAFIFLSVDPLILAMWMWPPEAGDIVMGIGEIDNATGGEQIVWLVQNRDLTSVYPRTVTGSYAVPDFAVTN